MANAFLAFRAGWAIVAAFFREAESMSLHDEQVTRVIDALGGLLDEFPFESATRKFSEVAKSICLLLDTTDMDTQKELKEAMDTFEPHFEKTY